MVPTRRGFLGSLIGAAIAASVRWLPMSLPPFVQKPSRKATLYRKFDTSVSQIVQIFAQTNELNDAVAQREEWVIVHKSSPQNSAIGS
jgi:hypothetical protein